MLGQGIGALGLLAEPPLALVKLWRCSMAAGIRVCAGKRAYQLGHPAFAVALATPPWSEAGEACT